MSTDRVIAELVAQDYSSASIASYLGMNPEYVRQRLRAMGLKAGRKTVSMLQPESYLLRSRLGMIITDLMEKELQPMVSMLTGLNRNELADAKTNPYNHDWKLSQIERTLATQGLTMKDIL
jgi:AraC-like DNA-binding protein